MGEYRTDPPDLGTALNDLKRRVSELEKNQLQGITVGVGAPTSTPLAGTQYLDSTGPYLYVYTGSAWKRTGALV